MKHINLTSWRGSITDWTKLNYIKGGLPDYYADIANTSGNIVRKSNNICNLKDISETTVNGITYSVENGVVYLDGTAESEVTINIECNEFTIPISFNSGGGGKIAWNNNFDSLHNVQWQYFYNNESVDGWGMSPINRTSEQWTLMANKKCNSIRIVIVNGTTVTNGVIKHIMVNNTGQIDTFEPYGSPVIEDNSTTPPTIIVP